MRYRLNLTPYKVHRLDELVGIGSNFYKCYDEAAVEFDLKEEPSNELLSIFEGRFTKI